jgi:predicted dithiol-disulfide oxidoreductase (DUF899 family)
MYVGFGVALSRMLRADNILDMCPKGRDEDTEGDPQSWVRYHDEYRHASTAGGKRARRDT